MKGFVERWFGSSLPEPVVPVVPDGQRIYCIGDIHGRVDLLEQLHRDVQRDAASYAGRKSIVYLGDYIDRGRHSREVIELLLHRPLEDFSPVYLLGNHEQAMLDFLHHPRAVASWLTFGGVATLWSYGVAVAADVSRVEFDELRDELEARVPPEHLEFLRQLRLFHLAGNYCFVHAGIRPGIPLQEQSDDDLLWIREDFTESPVIHEHIVVHGHTISPRVEFRPNRIGIDTGAFHTGVLTCLVLEGGGQRLLQTGAGA